MQHEVADGLVIRVRDVGDHDRYLTVLTAQHGRITLLSKGGRSMRGTQRSVSQLYTYANFEYYKKGDFYILKGGSPIQPFYSLSIDIDRLNLAAYLCEVTYELTDEGAEAGDILRLLLNALHAISNDLYPQETVKAAFEFRAAALSGYAPELDACGICGKAGAESLYLDVMNGSIVCSDCLQKRGNLIKKSLEYDDIREADILCRLTPAVRAALCYVLHAPANRVYSFELKDGEDLQLLSTCAQTYLLSHLGRGFESLNFYHTLRHDAKGKKI